MEQDKNNTLGYHRRMSAAVFGEESKATKFLDEKIKSHTNDEKDGADEVVIIPEGQLIALLFSIHTGNKDEAEAEIKLE